MIYIHVMEPVTARFLDTYGVESMKLSDAFSGDYVVECQRILVLSYSCSLCCIAQFLVLLWHRRVECVLQAIGVLVLIFLQTEDYLRQVWLLESYSVIIYGV